MGVNTRHVKEGLCRIGGPEKIPLTDRCSILTLDMEHHVGEVKVAVVVYPNLELPDLVHVDHPRRSGGNNDVDDLQGHVIFRIVAHCHCEVIEECHCVLLMG